MDGDWVGMVRYGGRDAVASSEVAAVAESALTPGPASELRVRPYRQTIPATFLTRPNRFVAMVSVSGKTFRCRVPDPGRLEELLLPGTSALVSPPPEGGAPRTTSFDLVAVKAARVWVSLNTHLPNQLIRQLLENRRLVAFAHYHGVRPEVAVGRSRLDFLLDSPDDLSLPERCFVEVKSANLVVEGGVACFPDSPSERASRHLRELIELRQGGDAAAVVFVVQRPDAWALAPNDPTDPLFAHTLREALDAGVVVLALRTRWIPGGVVVERSVPVLRSRPAGGNA